MSSPVRITKDLRIIAPANAPPLTGSQALELGKRLLARGCIALALEAVDQGRVRTRQPRKGRQHVLLVAGEYDPNAEFRKRGIVLGPDDDVMWIELVGVQPPD